MYLRYTSGLFSLFPRITSFLGNSCDADKNILKSESYYNKEESFILTSVNAESAGPKISHDTYCWFTFKYLTQKSYD
ncbi:MAG: hypothetical protein N4A36_02440 [Candidatus Gracilibacteria bacterium]|nr:hypothetical protein [Candidatus Gracilibacteria bacterium]